MRLLPIDQNFALELEGLQLWKPLSAQAVREIRRAWASAGVLVARRQSLSEDELAAVAAAFGDPEPIVREDWASPYRQDIIYLSNFHNAEGHPIGGLGANELDWHSDQSYMAKPATGSLLYMVEMPRRGGLTCWANLKRAYAALPAAVKTRIESLRGVFSYRKRQAGYGEGKLSRHMEERTPDVSHPLVNTDPLTGERALYLDPSTMVGIEGLSDGESKALLDELNQHATQPQFVYRHRWQIGDVILWDNGFMLHRRDAFPTQEYRLLKRASMRLPADSHIVPG